MSSLRTRKPSGLGAIACLLVRNGRALPVPGGEGGAGDVGASIARPAEKTQTCWRGGWSSFLHGNPFYPLTPAQYRAASKGALPGIKWQYWTKFLSCQKRFHKNHRRHLNSLIHFRSFFRITESAIWMLLFKMYPHQRLGAVCWTWCWVENVKKNGGSLHFFCCG